MWRNPNVNLKDDNDFIDLNNLNKFFRMNKNQQDAYLLIVKIMN